MKEKELGRPEATQQELQLVFTDEAVMQKQNTTKTQQVKKKKLLNCNRINAFSGFNKIKMQKVSVTTKSPADRSARPLEKMELRQQSHRREITGRLRR